ncbi:fibrillin-1 isoform X2 [Lutzomyia longipalpis]|uniref:fibrillin-1 isoform X2 n=1 Tax=Lutzomyia longipalpis TaxID=7200 RepID=UPI0024836FD3|nr:fibrillin-1 isoform X2 [Lutzomyia longipalpis]
MWIDRAKEFLWIILLVATIHNVNGQYFDCEQPPPVEHASSTLSVDDAEDSVAARYTCDSGFELQGQPDLFCDLDTDEWQGQLPTCRPSDDARASEGATGDHQQQRKRLRNQNIQEETAVDDDLASQLDLSCMGGQSAVKPPNIENAYVVKFNRRRKGDNIFLVAFYECEDYHELKDPHVDRMYCSRQAWVGTKPECVYVEDGEDGEDDYDDTRYDDEISQEIHSNEAIHPEDVVEEGEEEEYDYEHENQEIPEEVQPPEQHEVVTESHRIEEETPSPSTAAPTTEQPAPTEPPYIEPTTPFDPSCGPDRGGCDHECRRVRLDHGHESHVECSCFPGYELNVRDGRTCNDIDECAIRNGGCEQHCRNVAGSFECFCEEGLQIDTANGRSCIDINECLDETIAAQCPYGCENVHGSYRCLEPPTTTTTEAPSLPVSVSPEYEEKPQEGEDPLRGDHRREEDEYEGPDEDDIYGEYEERNNEVEGVHPEQAPPQEHACPEGFNRNHQGECEDINECEDPHQGGRCPYGCVNVEGSYYCADPPPPTTTEAVAPVVEASEASEVTSEQPTPAPPSPCGDGFRRNSDGYCEDIDECQESHTGCDFCKNVHGGFECYCPPGYEMGADEKTCNDINECEIYGQGSEGSSVLCSHLCENTPGSFACLCPEDYHLDYDRRTCVKDSCADLAASGKTLCSHSCIDNGDGHYTCQCPPGFSLSGDQKTCIETVDPCSGHAACHPGRCFPVEDYSGSHSFRCDCPAGYTEKHQRCLDVDECASGSVSCTHGCRNTEGGYQCVCPAGFELAEDGATCLDQDECLGENPCGSLRCVNTLGSYKCVCPEGQELHSDGLTCTSADPCAQDNGGCSHQCNSHSGVIFCSCPGGFELGSDGKTCRDVDECASPTRGGCDSSNGACVNSAGSYSCLCRPGFELSADNHTCRSLNPCDSAGCGHYCDVNDRGEPTCSCRIGFKLDRDRKSCLEIRDLCPPIKAPQYGEMRCSRSRHPTQYFYRTRCSIWCQKGYKLDGASVRTCNGTGMWDAEEPTCVPRACPRLPRPQFGTIFPTSCMLNGSATGDRCLIHCFPGFKPAGKRSALCDAQQNWTPSGELTCVSALEAENRVEIVRPFIRCPEDVTVVAPKGQTAFNIRLQRPQTNVDWWKYVDTHPEWAKHLEGTVPLGVTEITFRARSPNANLNEICRMKVTVKEQQPPEVTFCPESIAVQLEEGETFKAVFWKEPTFSSHSHLKQIYKSRQPGERFAPGVHFVTYVATDFEGMSSKCSFRIVVKEPVSEAPKAVQFIPSERTSKLLDNHESFLVCPGKAAVRIDTNYPLHLPPGCYVKNILIRYNVHRKPQQLQGATQQQQLPQQQLPQQQLPQQPIPQRIPVRRYHVPGIGVWPHQIQSPFRHYHRWAFPHTHFQHGRWN